MPHLIHTRIQEFFSGGGGGGGGGPGPTARKRFFLFLNLFYRLQKGSNGYITEKTIFFQGARGGPMISRGVQMLISIETHITCDFPGGGGGPDPLSPTLDLQLYIFH